MGTHLSRRTNWAEKVLDLWWIHVLNPTLVGNMDLSWAALADFNATTSCKCQMASWSAVQEATKITWLPEGTAKVKLLLLVAMRSGP